MGYLLTQMFLYMLGAFLLGLALGWLIWGRLKADLEALRGENARLRAELDRIKADLDTCGRARAELERSLRDQKAALAAAEAKAARQAAQPAQLISQPPQQLISTPAPKPKAARVAKVSATPKAAPKPKAPAKPDNLRTMIGIGPVNERKLHGLGVTTFAQISKWTAADIKRVEEVLEFDGRIERERWIEQAKLLAAGEMKEFLRRFPTAGTGNNT